MPEPEDPTVGFIQSQGHYLMHLAFGISTIFVTRAQKEPVTCTFKDDGVEQTMTYDLKGALNEELFYLMLIHFACFTLILISNYKECRDLESHYTVLLKLFSVILYTFIILKAQDTLVRVKLMFGKEDIVCNNNETVDMGSVLEWLILEICGFYVNVIVSISVILLNYSSLMRRGSMNEIANLRIDRMIKYIRKRQFTKYYLK